MRATSRRTVILTALLCVLLPTAPLAAGPEDGKDPKPAGRKWLSAGVGLERASKEKKVALLVWGGRNQEAFWEQLNTTIAGSSPLKKRLASILTVRIVNRSEKSLLAAIGHLNERSTIVVVDFRGVTVDRWDGEMPKVSVLSRAVKKAVARNAGIAELYRKVENIVEKSRYAHRLKKPREAIQLLLEGEKVFPLPPESQPVKDLAELRARLDAECTAELEDAKDLEEKNKLVAALDKYQVIQRAYPFPKRKMEITRHIGRVTRLLGIGY